MARASTRTHLAEGGDGGALSSDGPPTDESFGDGVDVRISPGEVDGESRGRWNQFALVYWQYVRVHRRQLRFILAASLNFPSPPFSPRRYYTKNVSFFDVVL